MGPKMLLKELKQLREAEISRSIINHLENQGYELLGSGVDQHAFRAPDGSILKIFGTDGSGQISESQKMFEAWYHFCKKYKHSHLVPQFLEYRPFIEGGNHYLQIKMERLFPLTRSMREAFEVMVHNASICKSAEDFKKYVETPSTSEKHGWGATLDNKASIVGAIENIEEFWQICRELKDIAIQNNWDLDMHEENAMLDDQGMLVITDPWYAGGDVW